MISHGSFGTAVSAILPLECHIVEMALQEIHVELFF